MAYNAVYYVNFCDAFGNERLLGIYRKDYTGASSNITAGASPIVISYKNDNDDKFNPITTSSAVINLIATETLSLDTFYTEDEREWKVILFDMETEQIIWVGFVIPDNSSEPFLSLPYEFSLKATDLLSTLKTIPYQNGNALIKKVAPFKEVLMDCLERTGLDLYLVTGVNTYFDTDDATAGADPLAVTFIDTTRFIDPDNKAFSCYDIIEAICKQFTANLKQVNGKWHFIDVSEYVYDTIRVREYLESGEFWSSYTISNSNSIVKDDIVNKDHNIEKEPAYKSVVSYYQYGFLSNKLTNGDFNSCVESPVSFTGWTKMGGDTRNDLGFKKNMVILPDGPLFFGDYSMQYGTRLQVGSGLGSYEILDLTKYMISDLVSVTKTSLISFTINAKATSDIFKQYKKRVVLGLKLSAPGETTKYWSGTAWQDAQFNITTEVDGESMKLSSGGASISFNASYPPYDGFLQVQIFGAEYLWPDISGQRWTADNILFDNATLNLSENNYYKSDIGLIDQIDNLGNYSKAPDPVVLLFGDDLNKNRTSWMRDSSQVPTAESNWFRYTPAGVSSSRATLQHFTTLNILNQYQKPSRRFEGSFRGVFTPVDTFDIPLIDGKFIFLAGDFDIKSAISRLVLAEVFTDEITAYQEVVSKDTGSFKNSSGSTVGSPTGVNIPPVNSTLGFVPEDTANKGEPNGYAPLNGSGTIDPAYLGIGSFDDFIKNQTTLQSNAKFHVYGGSFQSYLSVPKIAPDPLDMVEGLWYDWIDEDGIGGPGTAPPVIANLVDLNDVNVSTRADGYVLYWNAGASKFEFKEDSGGVSSWNELADKPTTLAGFGITDAINLSEKGSAFGVATLGSNGKLTTSQVPAIAITDTFIASSEASMLALSAAETGDVCVRTDLSKSFILVNEPYSTLANWQELLTPMSPVSSVNGLTGSVVLGYADVGAPSVTGAGASGTWGINISGTAANWAGASSLGSNAYSSTAYVPIAASGNANADYVYTYKDGVPYLTTIGQMQVALNMGAYLPLTGGVLSGALTAPTIKATNLFSPPSAEPNINDMEAGRWYEYMID